MKRRILFALALAVLAGAGAFVLFVATFDLERYRGELEGWAQARLGRAVRFAGPMHLEFWPRLALEVQDVHVASPPGFASEFAAIRRLAIGVELLPLLQRRLEIASIDADGVVLHLERGPGGGNWVFLPSSRPAKGATTAEATIGAVGASAAAFAVESIRLRAVELFWHGEGAAQALHLGPCQLEAGPLVPARPLDGWLECVFFGISARVTGTFAEGIQGGNFAGDLTLTAADLRAWLASQGYEFALPSQALRRVEGQGRVLWDGQTLVLDDMVLKLDRSTVRGKGSFSPAALRGEVVLAADTLDLEPWLGERAQGVAPRDVRLQGRWQDEAFAIDSLQGGAFGGRFALAGRVEPARQAWQTEGMLEGMDVAALLTTLQGTSRLTGRGEAHFSVTGRGWALPQWLETAAGRVQARIVDGAVLGVDVDRLLRDASSVLGGRKGNSVDRGRTPFAEISASALLERGVLRSQDFYGRTERFTVRGAGSVDLRRSWLAWRFTLLLADLPVVRQDALLGILLGVPIPLEVQGPLTSPKYRVVMEELAKEVAKEAIKRRLSPTPDLPVPPVGPAIEELLRGLQRR